MRSQIFLANNLSRLIFPVLLSSLFFHVSSLPTFTTIFILPDAEDSISINDVTEYIGNLASTVFFNVSSITITPN